MPNAPQPPADDLAAVPAASGEKVMGFLDHLEELRWTLVKCAITIVVLATLSGVFMPQVREFLEWPWRRAIAGFPELKLELRTDSPMEVYGVMVQVCLVPALVASIPFVLFFVGQFIGPALSEKEKRVLRPAIVFGVALFVGGAAFSYLLLVPKSIEVSITTTQWMGYAMLWTVGSYYSMFTWLVLGMGAIFEFPLLLVAASYFGIVEVATFRRSRRLVIVICLVAAAVITPTQDPVTMFLVAGPMWALFEISLVVATIIERRKALAEQAEWRDTYGT